MGGLTDDQVDTLILIERITASISVVGTLLLVATFVSIKELRILSNTLIVSGTLCQFQSFLLEMEVPPEFFPASQLTVTPVYAIGSNVVPCNGCERLSGIF